MWQLIQGKVSAAESTYAVAADRFPGWEPSAILAALRYARHDLDGAIAILDSARMRLVSMERVDALVRLARYAIMRGQFHKSNQLLREADALRDTVRAPSAIGNSLTQILAEAWFYRPTPAHVQRIDALVTSVAFSEVDPPYREYLGIARAYAFVGRPDRARALLSRYEMEVSDTAYKRSAQPRLHGVLGEIALAEQRPMDAVAEFRREDVAPDGPASICTYCLPASLARAYDAAGNADSTTSAIEQYLAIPLGARDRPPGLWFGEYLYLAPFEKRLGELYDAKGNHAKAAEHFQKFVDLWKHADADMQPKVNAVRQRLTQLRALERR
jgi:tetratricopeptide (TPR) repeat protein